MTITVTLYQSTDASAPVLTGAVGSLVALFDACLVNGYGAKAAAGFTKAFSATNKGFYTMGSGGTGFSFQIDDTGPGAGGAKEARITGFEVASSITTGTGQYPTNAQLTIGTAPAGAEVIRKSASADATARPWRIIASKNAWYLFIYTGDYTSPLMAFSTFWGDFFPFGSTDVWNNILIGRTIENSANPCVVNAVTNRLNASLYEPLPQLSVANNQFHFNVLAGHYAARAWTGIGGSQQMGKQTDQAAMGGVGSAATTYNVANAVGTILQQLGYIGTWNIDGVNTTINPQTWPAAFPYPNSPDAGLHFAPVWLNANGYRRGYMPGMWAPLQHMPLSDGDPFSGTGAMSGKSFMAINMVGILSGATAVVAAPSQVFIETSSTWA